MSDNRLDLIQAILSLRQLLRRVVDRVGHAGPGGTCLFCRVGAPTHQADCVIIAARDELKRLIQ